MTLELPVYSFTVHKMLLTWMALLHLASRQSFYRFWQTNEKNWSRTNNAYCPRADLGQIMHTLPYLSTSRSPARQSCMLCAIPDHCQNMQGNGPFLPHTQTGTEITDKITDNDGDGGGGWCVRACVHACECVCVCCLCECVCMQACVCMRACVCIHVCVSEFDVQACFHHTMLYPQQKIQ